MLDLSSNLNLDALATSSVYILLEKEPGLISPQPPVKLSGNQPAHDLQEFV